MSLAENLLNSLDSNQQRLFDDEEEPHIVLGTDRVISVPSKLRLIAVKGDKDIETVTIDCVRYWDGYDLSTFFLSIYITLPNGETCVYNPKQIQVLGNYFSFDWQIGDKITPCSGKLTFWIVAKLVDDNGLLVRQWSSLKNSEMTVGDGGDVENSTNVDTKDVKFNINVNQYLDGEIIHSYNFNGEVVKGTTWKEWCVTENAKHSQDGYDGDYWINSNGYVKDSLGGYYVADSNNNRVLWGDEIVSGQYSDYVEQVSTLNFRISNSTFEYEEGMTWQRWISSDYNKLSTITPYFHIVDGYISYDRQWNDNAMLVVTYPNAESFVAPSDLIDNTITYSRKTIYKSGNGSGGGITQVPFTIEGEPYSVNVGSTWYDFYKSHTSMFTIDAEGYLKDTDEWKFLVSSEYATKCHNTDIISTQDYIFLELQE